MITFDETDGIAIVTLNRPPVNAINEDWLDALGQVLDEIEDNDRIGVIWLRSRQRIFCAGADLDLMRARFGTVEGREAMVAFVRRIQQIYARIEATPIVSIAEINGAALGGGLELALACDLRIVAETAKVGLPEAQMGLLPGAGGTQRLTRCCGDAIARRLILGAEIIDGNIARQLGVAHWSVPVGKIEAFTGNLARRLAAMPHQALAACKKCIDATHQPGLDGFEIELAETGVLLASEATQTLVSRFLDKEN